MLVPVDTDRTNAIDDGQSTACGVGGQGALHERKKLRKLVGPVKSITGKGSPLVRGPSELGRGGHECAYLPGEGSGL